MKELGAGEDENIGESEPPVLFFKNPTSGAEVRIMKRPKGVTDLIRRRL